MLPFWSHAQNSNLQIKVEGITELSGKLMFKLSDENGKEVYKSSHPVKESVEIISLKLKPGKYALAIFHDANNNDELDKAFSGIPTEKYGFSNNARGIFGPPDLVDQLFNLEQSKQIKVFIKWKTSSVVFPCFSSAYLSGPKTDWKATTSLLPLVPVSISLMMLMYRPWITLAIRVYSVLAGIPTLAHGWIIWMYWVMRVGKAHSFKQTKAVEPLALVLEGITA